MPTTDENVLDPSSTGKSQQAKPLGAAAAPAGTVKALDEQNTTQARGARGSEAADLRTQLMWLAYDAAEAAKASGGSAVGAPAQTAATILRGLANDFEQGLVAPPNQSQTRRTAGPARPFSAPVDDGARQKLAADFDEADHALADGDIRRARQALERIKTASGT